MFYAVETFGLFCFLFLSFLNNFLRSRVGVMQMGILLCFVSTNFGMKIKILVFLSCVSLFFNFSFQGSN